MNEVVTKENIKIEDMIYEIRGKQVMLDSDLARIYETKTKRINEAVYRNKEKFPERFNGDRRYNIRVFTEQGVAMLAIILKTKVATEVSIQIMDAFASIRKNISNNLIEQKYINDLALEHDKRIKALKDSLKKLIEKKNLTDKIKED